MPNPWDIPPWPERGDKDINIIFASVGRSLTYWETVEEALANVFAVFVGNKASYPATDPAIRAYGTIISSLNRTSMVSAAATAYFVGDPISPLADEAKAIINLVNGWAARRNDIAHGRVGTVQSRPGFVLYPSLYNTKKHPIGAKPTYMYSSTEIDEFRRCFIELQKRIDLYRRVLVRVPRPSA